MNIRQVENSHRPLDRYHITTLICTFIRSFLCRNLYAIPGLDYVAHEDILPYTTSETNPLQHELFDKFLMYQEGRDPPYVAQVCYNLKYEVLM